MDTRIKSNLKKKSEKAYPFEIFWEARDKAYFTEMRDTSGLAPWVEPCSLLYHNGMPLEPRSCLNRVKLSELRKKAKEMGVKGVYKMRKAELKAIVNNF